MGWSTRQVAELAGTTLKTVRHYHKIGLLDEPERSTNGYKQYGVTHLIRLLRIRRLVDLGVPLSDISAVEEAGENAEQALRALDAELAASINRQQRMRQELAVLLEHRTSGDVPAGFDAFAREMTAADRSFLMICAQILGPTEMAALRQLHAAPRSAVDEEFDNLPADASEQARQQVAERLAPEVIRQFTDHPSLKNPVTTGQGGEALAISAVGRGLVELYNPAQVDVLIRLHKLIESHRG
ncbi:MerR family transcriptional regulator [Saccharopolyspora sp. NFXS83]|uniref:MerR family transcriptional regulator n=1 Tax=Saccharopolyspora sp. NFXS83 TaxID=2993560 RepID=UPI00224B539A|nr:MerR family transcriptional regulator [Saccharopolyspora sp. NFXS83]MCX2731973.1 MerR family transcriptional regulator [Saccharopolyspora sp. NFXS83]